jgi:eukaryotic-like serine/threonine-protein kinase
MQVASSAARMSSLWAAHSSTDRMRETTVGGRVGSLPEVGDVVGGKYRVERLIGRGAMGAVFSARHELLGRQVALKLMSQEHADSPQSITRFFNEARAVARIESEHIARILDMGQTDEGSPFIVLELLEGEDLSQTLESRGPLPVSDVVGWIVQALEAMAEAHSLGIVHRDLKPANLFLARKRDGTSIVKVLDFGISKDGRHHPATALTATSSILGSPAYMAPEQLRDARTVDARADIWAIGVALYELLAGGLPFRAANVADMCVAILERDLLPVRSFRGDTQRALDDVVRRCLARDPAKRFPDVAALAEALVPFAPPGAEKAVERIRHLLGAGAGTVDEAGRSRSSRRRRTVAVVASAAAIVAALGAAMAAGLAARTISVRPEPTGAHPATFVLPARAP